MTSALQDTLAFPDADLSPELRQHALAVRAFARDVLQPHARRVDEDFEFRRQTVDDLAAAGMIGGGLPAAAGGGDWSPLQLVVAHEEIGAVCGNARGFLAVQAGLVGQALARDANAAQRERWLPALIGGRAIGCFCLTEPEAGSDPASLRAVATPVGGGYRLEGDKVWITNGGVADVGLLFATVDPALGRNGITAFLLPMDATGIERSAMPGVELGHRGSDHAHIALRGVEVPGDAVVGEVGRGFGVAMRALNAGRLSVAAGALGIHRAALAATVDFARSRQQFGAPIGRFQMVQERVADMAVELAAARQLVYRCAVARGEGREQPTDLAAAKLYATEAAARAADQAVLLHGGRGYSTEYPVERLLRDVMGLRIYEGTSMIQKVIIGRGLLGDA